MALHNIFAVYDRVISHKVASHTNDLTISVRSPLIMGARSAEMQMLALWRGGDGFSDSVTQRSFSYGVTPCRIDNSLEMDRFSIVCVVSLVAIIGAQKSSM